MSATVPSKTLALGLTGAAIGGCSGYFLFFWIARQGFYALALPGAFLGLGAGLCAGGRSRALACLCGIAALALGIYIEWRFAPFIADKSFSFFVAHLHQLRMLTIIMLVIGALAGAFFALGRDRAARAS